MQNVLGKWKKLNSSAPQGGGWRDTPLQAPKFSEQEAWAADNLLQPHPTSGSIILGSQKDTVRVGITPEKKGGY